MNSVEAHLMTIGELENLCWPISQIGEAMRAATRLCGLSPPDREGSDPPAAPELDQPNALAALNEWVETAAYFLGFEAEAIDSPYAEVEKMARGAGPALLLLPEGRILAVIKSGARHATVIAPDLKSHRAPAATICSVLRRPPEVNVQGEVQPPFIPARPPHPPFT